MCGGAGTLTSRSDGVIAIEAERICELFRRVEYYRKAAGYPGIYSASQKVCTLHTVRRKRLARTYLTY